MSDLATEIEALATLSPAQLREAWTKLVGGPPPGVRQGVLRLALAWEMQAATHGGLPRGVQQQLEQIASAKTRTTPPQPGMQLVREWNGIAHRVEVSDDRRVRWNGKSYGSLSEVARAITGTRWSGPAFFGLKQKIAA